MESQICWKTDKTYMVNKIFYEDEDIVVINQN